MNITIIASWLVLIFDSITEVRAALAQKSGNGGTPIRFRIDIVSRILVL